MLMGQQANTWPDLTRSKSRAGRPRLLFSASIMTQVSKRNVAMSPAGYFFEAPVVFLAQLLDPLGGPLLELGMVLVFPGTGGGFQGFDLAQAHQLLFRRLGEKSTAPPLADDGVNLGNQLLGDDDMSTFDVHTDLRRPTCSLTGYGIPAAHQRVDRQQAPPEIPQQIEPQGVRPVGERLLGAIVFARDAF